MPSVNTNFCDKQIETILNGIWDKAFSTIQFKKDFFLSIYFWKEINSFDKLVWNSGNNL